MKFNALVENILNPKIYLIISGLHGDEPAGNIAAKYFENLPNVKVYSNLNKSKKRRMEGKDPNRHFDTEDQDSFQTNLINKIEKINPVLVISLHEDDEVDGVYAYCSEDVKDLTSNALACGGMELANVAHDDPTDKGVIVNGKQPYEGTLEKALKRRNISYCTIETPSQKKDISERANCLIKIVSKIIDSNK